MVVVTGVLGAVAALAFDVHASPGPIVLAFLGLGVALWLCPVYLIVSAVYLVRARRLETPAPTSEWVQAALFGLGSAALVGLALMGG
jgi:tellurite resistance protein TehA-like permease